MIRSLFAGRDGRPAAVARAATPPSRWARRWALLRLSLRFVVPLAVTLTLLAYLVVPFVDGLLMRWAARDLDARAQLVADALEEPLNASTGELDAPRIAATLERMTRDERLHALAVCDTAGRLVASTVAYPREAGCFDGTAPAALRQPSGERLGERLPAREGRRRADAADEPGSPSPLRPRDGELSPAGDLHVTRLPLRAAGAEVATLVTLHDTSYAFRRSAETQRYVIALFVGLGLLIALITVLVAHLSWRGWVNGVRAFLRGDGLLRPFEPAAPEIQPLVGDLRRLLKSVHEDRRILKDTTIQWRPETLKLLLREHLFGEEVIVVSNREPYLHNRKDDGSIVVKRPASGLVTAVEPVMRACSGTWIAHGSGSADADVVDKHGRVSVPPDAKDGSYTLRRLWLSEEEERGYYYGFANEGLWPLCHIAHVRPVFREEDWKQYKRVNERFADAVVAEARTPDPVVLVQDYHFALLPKLLRERLPRATILTFWHIPWPNAESFGICPWRNEILEGLLGSTILGFHTPYHCQNFLQTVDRCLEARIAHDTDTVTFREHRTKVRDYPISIHWGGPMDDAAAVIAADRAEIRARYGLPADHRMGIGVDRMDYTKGIVERFMAVERLLDLHPEWIGRFTLVQIAAPSRSSLDEYRHFEQRVREQAQRINTRFAREGAPPPIHLLVEQHDSEEVMRHFRAADVCVVTSLHDGMNLVAKEFIAARDNEDGVLILSRFAGAAGELVEALIVNPYHIDQTAEALHQGLTMHPAEQRERMRSLRERVQDFNIYRWAGRMLLDACEERQHEKLRDRIERATGQSVADLEQRAR
jgi:trehalose 6-phosphate synthase